VVHSAEERRRLAGLAPERMCAVVPHFVEERDLPAGREAAKARLGLGARRVISLVGFMTRRKGHRLVLEALPLLPADVTAVFAGAPIEGRKARGEELEAYARELGVADRVVFTGYVAEDVLGTILAATDVALCPFRDMSASGSLSTWISTGRPIVTSDLPAFREYDALVPGSMRTFSPLTAEGLATAVRTVLDGPLLDVDPAVGRLRQLLALPRMGERYVDVYRVAAR
jgi:glycosyltransferase involved in cell wall biosynthesis